MSRFHQGYVPIHFTTMFLKFAQVKLQTTSTTVGTHDNPAVIKKRLMLLLLVQWNGIIL